MGWQPREPSEGWEVKLAYHKDVVELRNRVVQNENRIDRLEKNVSRLAEVVGSLAFMVDDASWCATAAGAIERDAVCDHDWKEVQPSGPLIGGVTLCSKCGAIK